MFDKFKSLHIAVLGDLILDEYIYGDVQRISPEAPIPIVRLQNKEWRPGGAANVALNLHNLGIRTSLIGVNGDDKNGNKLNALIESICLTGQTKICLIDKRITTCKTRVIAQNQHIVRIDDEETTPISDHVTSEIIEKLKTIHSKNSLDAVIFQDYEKGLFHPGNIPTLIKACKDLAVKIIVDPKDKNFWNYKGVDLIKPNKKEAESALKGKLGLSEELLTDAAKKIVHNLENELTVITLSENGIFIKSKTDSIWQRSVTQNVVDVCGAGDAVISIIAAAWCSGLGLEDMATLSNLAGGIVCSERGVAAISLNGLKLAYENR